MADALGQPPAASPRTPGGGAQDTTPADPRQQLLHVLSMVLVQFESDASFGRRYLDHDARVSTIAQVRSFVHGRDDAPVEPPVLCRLAQILRDDEQSELAAVLYMQQIAQLSHNHDYGHVTGMHGAVSEHDLLNIISSHVELCGLVKGRATTRHADEALRLATVIAGRKDGDLNVTRSRLHEAAERLRQLRMAGQAARLGQQVARIDTAIQGQARDIASQPWSKANSRIPHANKPVGKRKPAQPLALSSGLAQAEAGAKDKITGETVVAGAADRRALLKATSDMKEVLGLMQRVAELEQLLANSEKRAQTAAEMAEADAAKIMAADRQEVEATYAVTLERAFGYAYRRGCARATRSIFYAWAVEVQRSLREQAAISTDRSLVNRAAAAEQRLVEARQQIFLMGQEQAQLKDQAGRAARAYDTADKLLQGWLNIRKRAMLQTLVIEWRNVLRKKARAKQTAEHTQSRWRLRIQRNVLLLWRMATTQDKLAAQVHHQKEETAKAQEDSRQLQQESRDLALNLQSALRAAHQQIERNEAITADLPELDSD